MAALCWVQTGARGLCTVASGCKGLLLTRELPCVFSQQRRTSFIHRLRERRRVASSPVHTAGRRTAGAVLAAPGDPSPHRRFASSSSQRGSAGSNRLWEAAPSRLLSGDRRPLQMGAQALKEPCRGWG